MRICLNVCVCGCSECVRMNPQTEADKRMYRGQPECDWMTVYAAMISLIYNGCPNGAPGPSRLQKRPHHYRLTDDRTSRADIILFILDLWYGGVTHSSVSSDEGKAHRWYSWKELRISIYRTKGPGTGIWIYISLIMDTYAVFMCVCEDTDYIFVETWWVTLSNNNVL